jgi:4-amino-4-deoxy-L-arabinose transferase-like glycosyltransferase
MGDPRPARALKPTPDCVELPWRVLGALVAARLGLYLLSAGPLAYGAMSDEYYYLDCASRLAWGYVDHPPLSVAVLAASRALIGESLLALRLLPALAHCALIVVVALLARELGGGRSAQWLAATAAFAAPVYLGISGFYSMNAFEPPLWAGAALLLARIVKSPVHASPARLWLGLGLVLGLSLLNKLSTLWLGAGIAVGLVVTRERRWLATPWPWLCLALALVLFAPHIVWQIRLDWPTAEFMRNATSLKMVSKPPLVFLGEQLLTMNPLLAPLWLAGLGWYFVSEEGRRFQWLAWIWLTVCLILLASGSSRSSYLGPAYALLLPAGGVAFERAARARAWRWLPPAAAALSLLGAALFAPLALDLLPPARFVAYQRALGIEAPRDQVDELGPLPLHLALRFGWPELAAAVAQAHQTLTPAERASNGLVVLTPWFGVTGAINFLGRERGLPRAISGHNNYWLWGPGDATADVMLAVAASDEQLRRLFARVERVAEVDCDWCMPDLARMGVYVCRAPRAAIADWWPEVKNYR